MTLWRRDNDSTHRTEPRVYLRAYVPPGGLEQAIGFYERLLGVRADLRTPYPEKGLSLATVGAFLLIEGAEETVEPFRATHGTLLVDDVAGYLERLEQEGAEITDPPVDVPTGVGFTARHPDGTVVEYVHHRPQPHEV
ncbi:putative enzyme related to lactoylglutathione lyase [Saccharothrix tamanrassetensis]|uniref:Putative enzyme related to lactoylglutathione lyase n=1 Tax=Saccharothrix tamanrassetensis TaxID=1051531 RepID=A0A841CAR8_9PSEU|nr:VOC family protein [Saccharothrix tamanrassetensis]MBB5955602.1 putative enzyme related to lactoylglutathione lyase [Saccharothrix tamanrassetensis]